MFNGIFIAIVVIVSVSFIWEQILSALNRSMMQPEIPELLRGINDKEEYANQQAYQKAYSKLGIFMSSMNFVLTMGILFFGLYGWFYGELSRLTNHFLWLPLLFSIVSFVIFSIIDIPFSYYDTFVIEERFGFNTSTKALFVKDTLIEFFLNLVISSVLLAVLLLLYHYLGQLFWLPAWLCVLAFSLVFSYFYSELIVPLFNKQDPLEEGELHSALESLAIKTGFEIKGIYKIDGSKRSTKANAYFTGFGKKKRIVLFDTLIDDLEIEEITAVLAHEIGHYKKRHIISMLIIGSAISFMMFFLMSFFVGNESIAQALGGKEAAFILGYTGFMLLFKPIQEVLEFLQSVVSRKHEYQADAFAAGFGLAGSLISALTKLETKSLSNLTPHPMVVIWEYSHPTLLQRIEKLKGHTVELPSKNS